MRSLSKSKWMEAVQSYVLYFFFYSMLGWLYEVFLEVVVYRWGFTNRGVLLGPYCPVYGVGALVFLLAFSRSIAAVLRGAGKAVVPMIVMMVCWCIIRVAFLTVTIPLTHSIQMVYWVYPLTWSLSSLTFLVYYKKANWMAGFDKEEKAE